ncbi:hypothetical protein AOLI_G00103460 [Acnodon oligacanthus]
MALQPVTYSRESETGGREKDNGSFSFKTPHHQVQAVTLRNQTSTNGPIVPAAALRFPSEKELRLFAASILSLQSTHTQEFRRELEVLQHDPVKTALIMSGLRRAPPESSSCGLAVRERAGSERDGRSAATGLAQRTPAPGFTVVEYPAVRDTMYQHLLFIRAASDTLELQQSACTTEQVP